MGPVGTEEESESVNLTGVGRISGSANPTSAEEESGSIDFEGVEEEPG